LNRLGVWLEPISLLDALLVKEWVKSMPENIFHDFEIIDLLAVPEQGTCIEEDSIAASYLATMTSLLHVTSRMCKYNFIDGTTAILRNILDFFNKNEAVPSTLAPQARR
jgi:hypothetical protein